MSLQIVSRGGDIPQDDRRAMPGDAHDVDFGHLLLRCRRDEPRAQTVPREVAVDAGNVLIVEVSGRSEMPRLRRVPTGALHWQQVMREIGGAADVEHVIREIDALPDPAQSLLEVRLTAILHPSRPKHMGELRDKIAAAFRC